MSLKADQAKAINNLYHRANDMSAQIALHGSVDCRSAVFEELMTALYDIDGGEYDSEFNPIAASQQEQLSDLATRALQTIEKDAIPNSREDILLWAERLAKDMFPPSIASQQVEQDKKLWQTCDSCHDTRPPCDFYTPTCIDCVAMGNTPNGGTKNE